MAGQDVMAESQMGSGGRGAQEAEGSLRRGRQIHMRKDQTRQRYMIHGAGLPYLESETAGCEGPHLLTIH